MTQMDLIERSETKPKDYSKYKTVQGYCQECRATVGVLPSVFKFNRLSKEGRAAGRPKEAVGNYCPPHWDALWKLYHQSTNLSVQASPADKEKA